MLTNMVMKTEMFEKWYQLLHVTCSMAVTGSLQWSTNLKKLHYYNGAHPLHFDTNHIGPDFICNNTIDDLDTGVRVNIINVTFHQLKLANVKHNF